MAYFAEINESNIVTNVIRIPDEVLITESGIIDESLGEVYCKSICNSTSKWIQTWKEKDSLTNKRFNYASVGSIYDPTYDVFLHPKPYDSWILDTNTFSWVAPVEKPSADPNILWIWDEENLRWIQDI